jgi:hypothetical protein
MHRPSSAAAALVLVAALSAPATASAMTATGGNSEAYCQTLRAVRAVDRSFDEELEERGIDALSGATLARARRLFRRLASTAPRAVEDAAEYVADFSLRFLDVAAGENPLRAIEEYLDDVTPAEERRLGRAVRELDRFSERRCGVPFRI